jgi:glutamate synthase (ferredoxin)
MSGGVAYVFDEEDELPAKCNKEMVSLQKLTDAAEIKAVKCMLERHAASTQSEFAKHILAHWEESLLKFVCVVPNDYARMMQMMKEVEASGLSGDEAMMAAFDLNTKDVARVSGN